MPNEQASHGVSPAPPPPSATAGKLIRNWAPIAAAILAVVLVAAILLLHYHLRINTNQANKWKHILAMVGAAFALVGSLFPAAMLDFFQIFSRRGAPITHVARTRTGAHEAIS
jgi:hypothetical protein